MAGLVTKIYKIIGYSLVVVEVEELQGGLPPYLFLPAGRNVCIIAFGF